MTIEYAKKNAGLSEFTLPGNGHSMPGHSWDGPKKVKKYFK